MHLFMIGSLCSLFTMFAWCNHPGRPVCALLSYNHLACYDGIRTASFLPARLSLSNNNIIGCILFQACPQSTLTKIASCRSHTTRAHSITFSDARAIHGCLRGASNPYRLKLRLPSSNHKVVPIRADRSQRSSRVWGAKRSRAGAVRHEGANVAASRGKSRTEGPSGCTPRHVLEDPRQRNKPPKESK